MGTEASSSELGMRSSVTRCVGSARKDRLERHCPFFVERDSDTGSRRMRFRYIAIICISIVVCYSPSQAQFVGSPNPPEAHLVFLPGYIASKLYTCPSRESDLPECVPFYGDETVAFTRQDLSIKPGAAYRYAMIESTREPFDFFVKLRAFVTEYSLNSLQFVFEGKNFYGVPYDWRRGIRENAAHLHGVLCAKAMLARNHDIDFFILAHSMGGNVLKEWMRAHSQGPCANEKPIKVRAVAFAGAPLLGSVKPLHALFNGLSILPPPYNPFGRAEQIGPSIVQSSVWMQSTFDILPALANISCFDSLTIGQKRKASRLPYAIQRDNNVRVDLYKENAWNELNFFRYFKAEGYQIPSRATVQERLALAAETTCALATYDPKVGITDELDYISPVIYLAGRQSTNQTMATVKFAKDTAAPPTFVPYSTGDGTVSEYSASDELVASKGDIITVPGSSEHLHLALLSARETRSVLEAWLTHAGFLHHVKGSAQPKKQGGSVDPLMLPIPPNPRKWREAEVQAVIQRNRSTLAAKNLDVRDYAKQALSRPMNFQRIVSLCVAASLAPEGSEEQIDWTLNAAETAVALQNIKVARALVGFGAEQLLRAELREYRPAKIAEYVTWFKTFENEMRPDDDPDAQRLVELMHSVVNRFGRNNKATASLAPLSGTGETPHWTKLCTTAMALKSEQTERSESKRLCLTQQEIAFVENERLPIGIGVREIEGDADRFLMITVPSRISKADGLRALVYSKDQWSKVLNRMGEDTFITSLDLETKVCNPGGCTAETDIQPAVIQELRNEGGLIVLAKDTREKPVKLMVPLHGFNAAYTRRGASRTPSSGGLAQALATAEILARMHADTDRILYKMKKTWPAPTAAGIAKAGVAKEGAAAPIEQERMLRQLLEWEKMTPSVSSGR
jgi:invasion protein IalB